MTEEQLGHRGLRLRQLGRHATANEDARRRASSFARRGPPQRRASCAPLGLAPARHSACSCAPGRLARRSAPDWAAAPGTGDARSYRPRFPCRENCEASRKVLEEDVWNRVCGHGHSAALDNPKTGATLGHGREQRIRTGCDDPGAAQVSTRHRCDLRHRPAGLGRVPPGGVGAPAPVPGRAGPCVSSPGAG